MSFLTIVLFLVITLGIGILYFRSIIAFADFLILCNAEGISSRNAMMLWSVAQQTKQHNHLHEIFEDSDFLNRCIQELTRRKDSHSPSSKRWGQYTSLLDTLYGIRQSLSVEVNSTAAISSSVNLPEDSALTFTVSGLGGMHYHSKIVSNNNSGVIIKYPSGPQLPLNFSWRGKQALVNLLVGDLTFRFAMTFDSDYWDRSFATLRLLHSETFVQEQNRNNVRYNVHIPAIFSVLASANSEDCAVAVPDETKAGSTDTDASTDFQPTEHRSVVKDLSLSGCRILVSAQVCIDASCKIVLRLNGEKIPVQGIIRFAEYIKADDFSYVRIQFTHIARKALQKICSFIYGSDVAEADIPPTPQESKESSEFFKDFADNQADTFKQAEKPVDDIVAGDPSAEALDQAVTLSLDELNVEQVASGH